MARKPRRVNLLQKAAISLLGLDEWASRHDRDNFRTNRVTVAQWDDMNAATGTGAIGISTTWACVNLLAGTIASLPLMIYEMKGGQREVAKGHPLYRLLHDSPNYDQTAVDFWEFMQGSIELHGNAFAEKEITGTGRVLSLTPIRPDLMKVRRRRDGAIEYDWTENGVRTVADQDRILHIRGFGGGPLGGASTLAVCGRTFGAALAVDTAARSTFTNGVRASGVFSADTAKPLTRDQMDQAQELIETKYVGAMNAGRPMLLNGLKWQQLTINPEDAQMLETRRFSVEEICRVFGVPPHMIGHTENSTSWGTGLEQQTLGFQKFTLRRRLKRIEQALEKQLLTTADRAAGVTIEFNIEGLLRGDSKSRAEFYQAALGDTQKPGWMVRNEVRRLENLPPIDGWDDPIALITNDAPAADAALGVTP